MNLLQVTRYLSNPIKSFIFFLALGILAFSNGLNHPFMIDDHSFFDEMSRNPASLWVNFIPDKNKVLNMAGASTEVYYRPFALIMPKLIFIFFHGKAWLMHLINLLCFVSAAWYLARWLTRLSGEIILGVLTGMMFLLHPLNGIIVNFKTAGIFAVQVICMIRAIDCLLADDPRQRSQWQAALFFLSALFFHESAFILPPALLIILLTRKKTLPQALRQSVVLWGTAAVYFVLRLQWASLSINIFDKYQAYHFNGIELIASWFSLVAWYISKLFLPTDIAIFSLRPVVHEHVFVWVFGGTVCLIGLIILFKRWHDAWASLGFAWFVLGMLMLGVGALFHGQELMVEPHWMVFASIGFFIVMTRAVQSAMGKMSKQIVWGVVATALMGLLLMTRWYNHLWDDEIKYCQHWLRQAPGFKPINMYIARLHFSKGNLGEAAQYYQLALTGQKPDYLMYCNLGTIALLQGKLEEAAIYLEAALRIEPRAATALNALGIINIKQGRPDKAKEYFLRSMEVDPYGSTARKNLELLNRIKDDPSQQSKPIYIQP